MSYLNKCYEVFITQKNAFEMSFPEKALVVKVPKVENKKYVQSGKRQSIKLSIAQRLAQQSTQ